MFKLSSMSCRVFLLLLPLSLAVVGCGPPPEKPKDPGKSWMDNLEVKNPGAKPDLSDDDDDDDDDEPAAKPSDKPKPPPIEIKPPSGRPAIIMGPKSAIKSTFGATPGATLKLGADGGNITLRIKEWALPGGFNIEFKVDSGKNRQGAVVGSVAYLKLQPGDKLRAKAVPTKGPDYELSFPQDGGVNLAIGTIGTDKAGNEEGKLSWKVIAPARVEHGETVFVLKEIGPVMYLHATTDQPTEQPTDSTP